MGEGSVEKIYFVLFLGLVVFSFFVILDGGFLFSRGVLSGGAITGVLKGTGSFQGERFPINLSLAFVEGEINRIWDLAYCIEFNSIHGVRGGEVHLNYLILSESNEIVYADEEDVSLNFPNKIYRHLDVSKIRKFNLSSGNYTFILTYTYLGKTKTLRAGFRLNSLGEGTYSVRQLFDISLKLDSLKFNDLQDLGANVVFESFGSEPTPVNLTFIVEDNSGKEFYRDEVSRVVQTKEVVRETFSGIQINPGKMYRLYLIVNYNGGVIEKYHKDFFYERRVNILPFVLVGLIIILALFFVFKNWFKNRGPRYNASAFY